MNTVISIALLLATVVISIGAEASPEMPAPAQVANILGTEETRVSADNKDPNPKLQGKVIWLATYRIKGEQGCALTITLFPDERIKTDFIEKVGENQADYQKVTKDDGDVIHHGLGDRGAQGTFYMTTLVNHENDWDMTLMLFCEPGVDESKLPIAIAKEGIKLIGEFEAILRKPTAQSGRSKD